MSGEKAAAGGASKAAGEHYQRSSRVSRAEGGCRMLLRRDAGRVGHALAMCCAPSYALLHVGRWGTRAATSAWCPLVTVGAIPGLRAGHLVGALDSNPLLSRLSRFFVHGRFVSQARGPAPPAARPTRRLTVPRARTGRKLGRRGREGEMVTKNAVRVLGYYGRRSRKGGRPKVLSLLYTLAGGNHDRAGAAFSWRGGPLGFL